MSSDQQQDRVTREWVREHARQIAVAVVVLLGASAVVVVASLGIIDGLEHYEPTEHDEYFEDQCNDRFGVEWEYSRWLTQPGSEGGEWKVVCTLDTGFLSGTDETISVTPPSGAST